ncbi:MAG: RNA polymerase factor sigma-54 [Phycisphaerae bacterium]|nr:RNA polymerase factor sigma-54 [Phycisphaerae bacterium]
MSSGFSLIPAQQMRLEQRLTPQLIQSMEILQLPLLALEARIQEELSANPVLEEYEPEAPEPRPAKPDAEDQSEDAKAAQKEAEAFERLDKLSREYELDPGDVAYAPPPPRDTGERDAKLDAMATTPSRGVSLQEHLTQQWTLIETPEPIKRAGAVLINWMDTDGYLRTEAERVSALRNNNGAPALIIKRTNEETQSLMEEIAASTTPPIAPDDLEDALLLVQTLDPLGVGARDLTECLLIQLDELPDAPPLLEDLVRNHLLDIAKNRLPVVAKALGRPIEEIKEALAVLGKLHHHPGLLISPTEVPRISPDIIVDYAENGDGYTVRLARGNTPRVRISSQYRQMLEERRDDKQAREFIRKHIESATALIDAIHYRRQRLLELARIVVERQREFLDYGPQHVKVLRMRDLADEFHCDPSTISRTVDEKYIQTPRGIFPLRMFFTLGTEKADGEAVSWDALKARVKEFVDAEDKRNPLHDEQIVEKFAEQGVTLSRRTIAKYRALLGIPPARQRQEF